MALLKIAPETIRQQMGRIINEYHPELSAIGVKIDLLVAFAKEDDEGNKRLPTLALNGYPANGIAKILGPKDRLCRSYDAEIIINGDAWDTMTPEQRDALLDHEITHFVPKRNAGGDLLEDDYGRPKLIMRKHDHHFGWFRAVAERHGSNSGEVHQATKLFEEAGQVYFGFVAALQSLVLPTAIEDSAPADKPKAKK